MHETESELAADMESYEFGFDRALASDAVDFLNLVTEAGKQRLARFGTEGGSPGDWSRTSKPTRSIARLSTQRCCSGIFSPT